jgi:outer membrane porin, OprD family
MKMPLLPRPAVGAVLACFGTASIVGAQQPAVAAGTPAPPPPPALVVSEPAVSAAASSTEQGQTHLSDSFDWGGREWRLEKRRAALRDTQFKVNLRTFYLDRDKFDDTESEALAIGGWAGFKTGYFMDVVSLGLTGYTSQHLHGDEDKDGTLLLAPGQEGYTALGELYADIRIMDDLNLYVGRKEYDTPFINRNDVRMTPNTFEAITLQGKVKLGAASTGGNVSGGGKSTVGTGKTPMGNDSVAPVDDRGILKYGIGYFDTIKERNSDEFVSMGEDAGADVDRGVFVGGANYQKGDFSFGAIDYYSPDLINIGYVEAKWAIPLSESWKPRLAAQFIDQRSVGDELLQDDGFSGQQFGLKAELPAGRALFTAGYTQTTGGTNMQNPWSGYPGYTSVQVEDFNREGEGAFLLRAGYDFEFLKGLSAYALGVLGTSPDQADQYAKNEYDFNLQWAPPEGVLKGLSLRLRYAVVEQDGGGGDDLEDFRVICNYAINF